MATDTGLSTLDLADALRPALLRLSRQLRREAGAAGLSALDAMLVAAIKHNRGVGVCELAELEGISSPTMSAHVKRLEAQGWIARNEPSCTDKRRTSLKITTAGEKALAAVRKQRNDWLAGRLAKLTEKELRALMAAVGALSQLAGEKF